jgi:hypothetical protein
MRYLRFDRKTYGHGVNHQNLRKYLLFLLLFEFFNLGFLFCSPRTGNSRSTQNLRRVVVSVSYKGNLSFSWFFQSSSVVSALFERFIHNFWSLILYEWLTTTKGLHSDTFYCLLVNTQITAIFALNHWIIARIAFDLHYFFEPTRMGKNELNCEQRKKLLKNLFYIFIKIYGNCSIALC